VAQGRLTALRTWPRRHPLWMDAALAVALGLVFASSLDRGEEPVGAWLLAAGLTAPLVLRRRAPLEAFGAIALVAFVQWLASIPSSADAALLVAIYSVAAYEPRRWGPWLALAILELGVLLAALSFGADEPLLPAILTLSAFVVASFAMGVYVRTRREHIAALTERAHQLERDRDQQGRLAAAEERARIAREMHDVVAHNLSVMIALADGAQLTAKRDPDAAGRAMGAVSSTGREALDEMRRLLGVLREHTETPLAPQPGLDQLDALVDQVRGAGLATRLTRTGEPAPLSPGAQLAVYRLVQEALTNTLKHARGASAAEVRLHYGEDELALEVLDDGAPAEAGPSGHGLAGMRERAAAYGAAVDAGPCRDGGWRVGARFPVAR
jgi:signal transduction histidine kinase